MQYFNDEAQIFLDKELNVANVLKLASDNMFSFSSFTI